MSRLICSLCALGLTLVLATATAAGGSPTPRLDTLAEGEETLRHQVQELRDELNKASTAKKAPDASMAPPIDLDQLDRRVAKLEVQLQKVLDDQQHQADLAQRMDRAEELLVALKAGAAMQSIQAIAAGAVPPPAPSPSPAGGLDCAQLTSMELPAWQVALAKAYPGYALRSIDVDSRMASISDASGNGGLTTLDAIAKQAGC